MKPQHRALVAVACTAAFATQPSFAQSESLDDTAAFQDFLREVRAEALERGISAATLDSVFPTIELHRRAVEEDRSQAEFVLTYERYLRRVSPRRIEQGRRLMADQGAMIGEVAAAYGVQPRFVVAIIGLESDYGTYPV
ncbi:MAG TPA: lytic murein transglycosylase, partial [Gammaproteobacteria bacterium]